MKILKFGGTSVGSPENIRKIASILENYTEIVVVVSAFGGTTDQLLEMTKLAEKGNLDYKLELDKLQSRHLEAIYDLISDTQVQKNTEEKVQKWLKELSEILHGVSLIKEASLRTRDLIMSFGERLSAYIISQYLDAQFLDTRELIKTDSNFSYARVDFEKSNSNIQEYFAQPTHNKLHVATGFIASDENNATTTLGRGGSDYTAAILGAALNAEEIQIWTDVDGIMTADPRKVKKAFVIPRISYNEAMEMSHFGAKVIHPPTMQPAMNKDIPIRIKNTNNPKHPGSVISKESDSYNFPIKGISSIGKSSLVRLQGSGMIGVTGISFRLFGALSREKINIILISQASSEHSICFAVAPEDSEAAIKAINNEFAYEIQNKLIEPATYEADKSILAIVGENMIETPGTSGRIFSTLGQNSVNIDAIAQGSSELNISVVIDKKDEVKALNAIHDSLFLSKVKTLNLFLVGTGLIGKTLLQQISDQKEKILEDQNLDLRIIALANSKKMLFNQEGISLQSWQQQLETSQEKSAPEVFTKKIIELNLPNSIFVDCTASAELPTQYNELLKNSISIVTPNKKGSSANLKDYLKLQHAAAKSNARFLYETNVGAGLPIIGTLQNLLFSGDKIHKIEAVLSGTLSYIFNSFDGSKPFSSVVKEAQENGYTEPDPRDDLNGLDVARKLLILARESGHLIDMEDLEVENLVPEACQKAETVEEFFEKLKENEAYFEEKRAKAAAENKKLCYIASLEGKKYKVELKAVDQNHPFYSLSGSDNIISFTTNRYTARPLVVKGPGAGAEVTAAGVFADILTVANKSFNKAAMKYAFLDKLKSSRLVLSLIGMSNIGKSTWSKRLAKAGFTHICCDDLIEDRLEPELKAEGLKGLEEMAKWLGQPYDSQFKDNQAKYLSCEKKTMEDVVQQIKDSEENIVVDTTGSVIYIEEDTLKKLNQNSLVVHIEPTEDMKEAMFKEYIKNPKPVIWGESFKKLENESDEEALARSYQELLEYRLSKYRKHADISLSYKELDCDRVNESQFLKLVTSKL